jgi:hypothetical protein
LYLDKFIVRLTEKIFGWKALDHGGCPRYNKITAGKEVPQMSTEKEILMFQKSTVYDLLQIIEKNPDKTYTTAELKELLTAYVKGLEQS